LNYWKKSENCITYTGAGLSRASGIKDYASKSKESIVKAPKIKSSLDAQPTFAHQVLVALERAGYLKYWIQQNHDGLPQKAGCPQEKINEIHGAWFDPSNPVVQFSGSLRTDLFQDMISWEKKADLCLCLGTSLSGMNADRMANTPAKKSLKGKALGTVIINLQQTPLDSQCAVRIWAQLDDAFIILTKKLGVKVVPIIPQIPNGDVYIIPYNSEGKKDEYSRMTLDLRKGSTVKIVSPGSSNLGAIGTIAGKRDENYCVELKEKREVVRRLMGIWMIDAAIRGSLPYLPLINENPKVEKAKKAYVPPASQYITNSLEDSLDNMDLEDEKKSKPTTRTREIKSLTFIQSHSLKSQEGSDNIHKWGLQLEAGAEHLVKEVTYKLHPTFNPPEVTLDTPPFAIDRLGWGTFTVLIAVELKSGEKFQALHKLSFKEVGDNIKETEIAIADEIK